MVVCFRLPPSRPRSDKATYDPRRVPSEVGGGASPDATGASPRSGGCHESNCQHGHVLKTSESWPTGEAVQEIWIDRPLWSRVRINTQRLLERKEASWVSQSNALSFNWPLTLPHGQRLTLCFSTNSQCDSNDFVESVYLIVRSVKTPVSPITQKHHDELVNILHQAKV